MSPPSNTSAPSATDPLLPSATTQQHQQHQYQQPSPPPSPRPNMQRSTTTSPTTSNAHWKLACLYGASAVALGAFGAHGLKKRITDPSRLANWATAAQYQLLHSAVLALSSAAAPENKLAANLFVAGMTMFSGSLYLLVLDPGRFRFLGPVTPLGGLCLIAGWGVLGLR